MSSAEAVGGGPVGLDASYKGGDRAGGTSTSPTPPPTLPPPHPTTTMDVDDPPPPPPPAPHSSEANGVLPPVPPSSSPPPSLKHSLPRDDDGQPQKKQRTQPIDDRPLRVHIPSTPSRSPSHPPTVRTSHHHPSPPHRQPPPAAPPPQGVAGHRARRDRCPTTISGRRHPHRPPRPPRSPRAALSSPRRLPRRGGWPTPNRHRDWCRSHR